MSSLMAKIPFFRKKEKKLKPVYETEVEIPVKLEIVNSMHQTMALSVSEIAKVYPEQFDMIKAILTEYAFFIETILNYRKTGQPEELFKKLQEFMLRSIKGYLLKYDESDEVIDKEKPVIKQILHCIATIQEQVEEFEGISELKTPISEKTPSKPLEDWGATPKIVQRGGMPNLSAPITDLKGIGEATAKKLNDVGVKTISDYIDYQRAKAEEENDLEDEETSE